MTRIQEVTAYKTRDGAIYETQHDANIHVASINAKIAHLKAEIKHLAACQRDQRKTMATYVELDRVSITWGRGLTFKRDGAFKRMQHSIHSTACAIRTLEGQLNSLKAKLRG